MTLTAHNATGARWSLAALRAWAAAPSRRGSASHRWRCGADVPAGAVQLGTFVAAALVGAVLYVTFHFWMGDAILPTIYPSPAFDRGLSLDTGLPPISLIGA